MDVLIYILILLSSFIGLLIGVIVSNIAIEEVYQASIYLKYLNIILVPVIIWIATHKISEVGAIAASGIILSTLIIFREKYHDAWIYSCIGAILYVSTLTNTSLSIAVLIFIYGMSIATINANTHFKKKVNEQIKFSENLTLVKRLLGKYSYYLLVGMVFYITFSYIL